MSDRTRNPAKIFPRLRGADGKPLGLCRYCKGPTPTRRHSWCSEECNHRAMIECGYQGFARKWLREREHGVCQRCGRDTVALERCLLAMRRRLDRLAWGGEATALQRLFFHYAWKAIERQCQLAGFNAGQSLWQADHIVPLVEGGSRAAENLQTLCVPCHKDDTAELARRRAVARNPQLRLSIETAP